MFFKRMDPEYFSESKNQPTLPRVVLILILKNTQDPSF
jgi:hypothetical protein